MKETSNPNVKLVEGYGVAGVQVNLGATVIRRNSKMASHLLNTMEMSATPHTEAQIVTITLTEEDVIEVKKLLGFYGKIEDILNETTVNADGSELFE